MSVENPNAGEDLNALEGIMSNHQAEIEDNTILQSDFKKLMDYFEHRSEHSEQQRRQILEHIIGELAEASADNLRMTYESPQLDQHEAETTQHLNDQETLRDALVRFRHRYLN